MLTSGSAEQDIVAGLAAGADDNVVQPVASAVLLARVNALGRSTASSRQIGSIPSSSR
jgi:DNA-binding response OmpR family regulator